MKSLFISLLLIGSLSVFSQDTLVIHHATHMRYSSGRSAIKIVADAPGGIIKVICVEPKPVNMNRGDKIILFSDRVIHNGIEYHRTFTKC
jgi:hypothetical protein